MKRIVLIALLTVLLVLIPLSASALCKCRDADPYCSASLDPTCTADGYFIYTCRKCDQQTLKTTRPALGHDWVLQRTLKPTCTEKGAEEFKCSRCGETRTEELDALGHQWMFDYRVESTCTEKGGDHLYCERCNEKAVNEFALKDHDYRISYNKDATCTEDGVTRYECNGCGDVKIEKHEATGHNWKETYSEPATCSADGYKSYECSNAGCKETKIETLPATGICSWGKWRVVKEPTCTEDGLRISECNYCGEKRSDVLPSDGAHDYKTVSTKKATCTEEGSKVSECTKCGKKKTETLKATGHDWKDGKIIKAATCTEEGSAESECKTCGLKDTRVIEATGHSWGSWKVTKKATADENGSKKRTCKVCGKSETQVIKATGSDKKDEKKSSNKDSSIAGLQVYTTAGKVNLRKGPGMDNGRTGSVPKKNTCLGELLDASVDSKGVVWFKVEYKNKVSWVTSDFAKVVVGEIDLEEERKPEKSKTELSGYHLRSFEPCAEALGLEESTETEMITYLNDAVRLSGWNFVEEIEVTGEGYKVYGIEVGDRIKDAAKKLKKENLKLVEDGDDVYSYLIPCTPYSLNVDEDGFGARMDVIIGEDSRVESILIQAFEAEAE